MPNSKDASASFFYFTPELSSSNLDFELSKTLKNYSPNQILLDISSTAKYLCFSTRTLATWRCNKRHKIPYRKKGKNIHYLLSDLNDFIEKHASQPLKNTHICQSLLEGKSAAEKINSTSGTLAVWVSHKNPDLVYIKIGRAVRYRPYDLALFNLERLRTRKHC